MKSDTIDAPVKDLEECIVRIEWLKSMLRPDVGEGAKSHWRYEDYRPPSTGKWNYNGRYVAFSYINLTDYISLCRFFSVDMNIFKVDTSGANELNFEL